METEIKTYVDSMKSDALNAIELLKKEYDRKYEEAKAAGAPIADLKLEMERFEKRLGLIQQEVTRSPGGGAPVKSLGQQFVEHAEFKSFKARSWHKGGMSVKVDNGSFFPEDFKTTITSAAVGSSTPGILVPERMPGIVKPGVRKVRVRDLMPRNQTENNAIEYVKENAFTNTASPVSETISKGESALTFSIASNAVRTIAHWIPAARQILDDFAQLQGYIDIRLIEGLKDVEDFELVAGDGTNQHLTGLASAAGAYDTARNVTGDTYMDQINHAISQIEDALQVADGIILHPRDWRKMQLIKTEEGGTNKGMYLLGGPAGLKGDPGQSEGQQFGLYGGGMLWGLPVATTTAVGRGTFFVGSFQRYTMVHDRMDARIDLSTEHSDYFIRNMVAIRAEERLALTVQRNDAVLYGSFV